MKKKTIGTVLSVIILLLLLPVVATKSYAATTPGTTVYGGVDYSAVYNYDYYINTYPDIKQAFGGDDAATLNHFINCGMSEGRQAISTFNVTSYKLAYPDLRQAFGNNLSSYFMHYIANGKREGRIATGVTQRVGAISQLGGVDYSAVYNYDYYVSRYPDVKQKVNEDDIAALNYFINYGMSQGQQAIATFDVTSYRLAYPDLRQAFGNNLKAYYMHYINNGKREGRTATGVTQLQGAVTKIGGVDYSAVYDYNYYVNTYPDIKQAFGYDDSTALSHFVNCGMSEGRQGKATFNVTSYRLAYPDLRRALGGNLKAYYMHYINNGKREGRTATGVTQLQGAVTKYGGIDYSAVYDYDYYVNANPDIRQVFGYDDAAVLSHFITFGMSEGRQANDSFNASIYRCNYPDLQAAIGNNTRAYYLHYIACGKSEGRNAKELFHDYTGWFNNYGTKYYYENGSYCTGWKTIAGRNYYFASTGVLTSRSGIDVSEWQGQIDWQKVKNDGIEFAMIRVGYGNDEPGQDDSAAAYNMSECERLGIPYGVYLYSYALNDDEARSEVAHVLRMVNGRHPSLGVYYDVEDTDYYQRHGLDPIANKAAINNFCNIFFSAMTNAGYKAGLYSNYYYLNNIININNFPNIPLWLAWPSTSEYASGNWNIWQYTSGGAVAGISGRVDMDVLINR